MDAEVVDLLLMLHEGSTDSAVMSMAARWRQLQAEGAAIKTGFHNPLLLLDHRMLVTMASLYEQCGDQATGSRLTGYTGPMSTLIK